MRGKHDASPPSTHLVINQRRQRQVVKEVGKVLPNIRVAVLPQALVVKSIDLRDLPRLVVASQDGNAVAVSHLEDYEEGDRLDGVVASVDVVAHEEVVCIR